MPRCIVSTIVIHGIPLDRHSFVGQGLSNKLGIKVARGHDILVSKNG